MSTTEKCRGVVLDIDLIERKILSVLVFFPQIKIAIIFGSWATGKNHNKSDVDIAVAADFPLNAAEKMNLMEKLALELYCEVDLVDLNNLAGTIFQKALTGKVVVKKDTILFATLTKKMIYNQEDMIKPYTIPAQKRQLERWLNG